MEIAKSYLTLSIPEFETGYRQLQKYLPAAVSSDETLALVRLILQKHRNDIKYAWLLIHLKQKKLARIDSAHPYNSYIFSKKRGDRLFGCLLSQNEIRIALFQVN